MPEEHAEATGTATATGTPAATGAAGGAGAAGAAGGGVQRAKLPEVLRPGDRDPAEGEKENGVEKPRWITYLQQMLNFTYQVQVVSEDGHFDDQTAHAVRHFREQNGLPAADTVDKEFWKKMGVEDAAQQGGGAHGGGQQHAGQQHAGQQHGGQQHGGGAQDGNSHEESFEDVEWNVSLVQQTTAESCWAAAMATVANIRGDGLDIDALCQRANTTATERLGLDRARSVGTEIGLQPRTCYGGTAQIWADVMRAFGPLWTPVPGDENHLIVLAGVKANGGHPQIRVLDPATGNDSWVAVTEFASYYGIGEAYQAEVLSAY